MKLQLDTENKTIKVEGSVKLSELVETLDKILPGLWKNFTLEANTKIIEWENPIYIKEKKYIPYWHNEGSPFGFKEPYWIITCQNNSDNSMLCAGKYSIES